MADPIPFPNQQQAEPEPNELLISGLELLRVKETDFVIIKTPLDKLNDGAAKAMMASLNRYCQRQNIKGVSVCVLPAGMELTVMSEEFMRSLGWKKASLLELATSLPPPSPRV